MRLTKKEHEDIRRNAIRCGPYLFWRRDSSWLVVRAMPSTRTPYRVTGSYGSVGAVHPTLRALDRAYEALRRAELVCSAYTTRLAPRRRAKPTGRRDAAVKPRRSSS